MNTLALLNNYVATASALQADAYYAQELPKLQEALAAVSELVNAANRIVEHDTDSPSHNRVLAAIARITGAP
jgi:hypothetical protein